MCSARPFQVYFAAKDSGFAVCGENPATFRGLRRKPGQRFAVCGGNPTWQILQAHRDARIRARFERSNRRDRRLTQLVCGASTGLASSVPFLSANCAGNASPNAMQNIVPVATKRNLEVSHAASGSALSASSGGSSRKSVIAAKPKQLSRRQPIVE